MNQLTNGCMKLFNIIFPPVCFACKKRIPNNRDCVCFECSVDLVRKPEKLNGEDAIGKKYFDAAFSIYHYNHTVRELIHNFKYKQMKIIGDFFSKKVIDHLNTDLSELLCVDGLVAVPMYKVKIRERSFNQAEYILKKISSEFGFRDYSKQVSKINPTISQSLQTFEKRISNPVNSFKINDKKIFEDKTILIIDDVFTTGATVNEIAKLLKANKCKKVYALTIASGDMEIRKKEL